MPGRAARLGLVGLGGAVGTGLRVALGTWVDAAPATLTVNLVGALLLGILTARVPAPDAPTRVALGTGLLGSFTTWSGLALLLADSPTPLDLGCALAAVLVGVPLAALGLRIGARRG